MTQHVLLITDGFVHPPFLARWAVRQSLKRLRDNRFEQAASLEQLSAARLRGCDALVLYYHHAAISAAALTLLDEFCAAGGGILAIHSATASFKQTPHYFEILGGRFIGHGPVQRMAVEAVDAPDSPFAGIGAFQIRDELYHHQLQDGVTVHFQVEEKGQTHPLVWTYHYGAGKVCYVGAGHTAASMRSAAIQAILQRGLTWVSA